MPIRRCAPCGGGPAPDQSHRSSWDYPSRSTTPGSPPDSPANTFSTPGTYYWQASYSGDSKNNAAKSSCGSEVETVTGSSDKTKPTCALTGVVAGPPKKIQVTVRDTGSGLAHVVATTATNTAVSIPSFTSGTTAPVIVTGTKVNQAQSSELALKVTDVAGNVTTCDPVTATVRAHHSTSIHGLAKSDHLLLLTNSSAHRLTVRVTVNGHTVRRVHLAGRSSKLVRLHGLHRGTHNRVVLRGRGVRAAHADVLIWNGAES